jgi:uncharacterized protein (DUF983 family)
MNWNDQGSQYIPAKTADLAAIFNICQVGICHMGILITFVTALPAI